MIDTTSPEEIERQILLERQRCAKLIPSHWCDPLLSGADAPKLPWGEREVEALLRGIQDRIRNSKSE